MANPKVELDNTPVSGKLLRINDRYVMYSDGVVYDTKTGGDIPSWIFEFRDFVTENAIRYHDHKPAVVTKGVPIVRYGQIRNKCWNCGNYSRENNRVKGIEPELDKGYYYCEFCNSIGHE